MALCWLREAKLDLVAQMISNGDVKIPGHDPNPEKNIVALLQERPPRPNLNILVFGPEDKHGVPRSLHLPKTAAQPWLDHPTLGMQFRQFLDKVCEENLDIELSLGDPAQQVNGQPEKKRIAQAELQAVAAAKKAKVEVDPSHVVPIDNERVPLMEVPLVSTKNSVGKLLLFAQNKMHLANTSVEEPLVVSRGTLLAGFGRGKWSSDSGDIDESKQLPYKLANHDDAVLNGTQFVTLLEIVNERRKTHPDCRVAYHDIVPQGDGPPGAFSLAKTVNLVFSPQPPSADAPAGHLQTRVAATVPVSAWNGHYSGVAWSVKWSANGLSPIRPQIAMLKDVTIRPGHSLVLN